MNRITLITLRRIASKGIKDIAQGHFMELEEDKEIGMFFDRIKQKIAKKHRAN